ncbi:LAMI_0D06656g1_1 [Lachancea mirantina]|uniref:LAMI_0D06656g1_1 n=1 Tax=Lachancea mirantina TaxID=1230905 RepID=A0A1G4JBX0_9SACH|nr:LAMI_0D06656g1_1 [Lachancea mirantina]
MPTTKEHKIEDSIEASNDPQALLRARLADIVLLSRSGVPTGALARLQESPQARTALFELIAAANHQIPESETIGHGLRLLREVLVSVYARDGNRSNSHFITFCIDVFLLSLKYHISNKQPTRVAPILIFVATHQELATDPRCVEILACYVLYISHMDNDVAKSVEICIQFLHDSKLKDTCLRLSLIYCARTEPLANWFEIVAATPESSLLRQFIEALPAFEHVKSKYLAELSRCYNQISLAFLSGKYFHGLFQDLETVVATLGILQESKTHGKTVKFKRAVSTTR